MEANQPITPYGVLELHGMMLQEAHAVRAEQAALFNSAAPQDQERAKELLDILSQLHANFLHHSTLDAIAFVVLWLSPAEDGTGPTAYERFMRVKLPARVVERCQQAIQAYMAFLQAPTPDSQSTMQAALATAFTQAVMHAEPLGLDESSIDFSEDFAEIDIDLGDEK